MPHTDLCGAFETAPLTFCSRAQLKEMSEHSVEEEDGMSAWRPCRMPLPAPNFCADMRLEEEAKVEESMYDRVGRR